MQIIGLISDVLLLAATGGMALWCRILTRRLKAFNNLDTGLGGTIATLTLQVDDLKDSLAAVTAQSQDRGAVIEAANQQADDRIGRMEMLLASLEDLEAEATDRLLEEETAHQAEIVPSFRASRATDRNQEVFR